MLKKAKLKIAAWSITGIIGAGSLFSGIAAQNVYAREGAAVESSNENTVDPGNTEITDQINENQGSYSDTSAGTLQSVPITLFLFVKNKAHLTAQARYKVFP